MISRVNSPAMRSGHPPSIEAMLEGTEREILMRALRAVNGHKGHAADALGISRHALKRRLKRVGMA